MAERLITCALLAFLLSVTGYRMVIPLLKRCNFGQNILCYVKEHCSKQGTPTGGGFVFCLAACVATLAFVNGRSVLICVAVGLAYLAVGLTDDALKIRCGKNMGLKAWQKLIFECIVAAVASVYCLQSGNTEQFVPFSAQTVGFGRLYLPFATVVFIATVNSVNLTDGLDGLAGGCSLVYFLFLGILILLQRGDEMLCFASVALAGALLGFLPYNANKASVFMGDTGSLALGGFAAVISLISGNALQLLTLGIPFVISSLSVIVQVLFFKIKRRRVFLMAPIHHHFQIKGFSESKIALCYALTSVIAGLLGILPYV